MDKTSESLARAIALIRHGQKEQARLILLALLKANPHNEAAWLWLTETAENDDQRMWVLEQCLKRIPQSQIAQKGFDRLRAKQGLAAAVVPVTVQPISIHPVPPKKSPLDIPTKPSPHRQPIANIEAPVEILKTGTITKTFSRFIRYSTARLVTMCIMITISVFLTIIVANLGGYLDKVVSANIDESIGVMVWSGWLKEVTNQAERFEIIEQTRAAMQESAGLNSPFLVRCVKYLWRGLTLDWGKSGGYSVSGGETVPEVRDVILDYLPRTLLVFGSANFLLFFTSIFFALGLARKYGSWQDRLITVLAPLAAAPSWVYGLIIAALTVHVLKTYTRPFDRWPPGFKWSYLSFYARSMLPAIAAIFLSKFFQSVYAW